MRNAFREKTAHITTQLSTVIVLSTFNRFTEQERLQKMDDIIKELTSDVNYIITHHDITSQTIFTLVTMGFTPWRPLDNNGDLIMMIPQWMYPFLAVDVVVTSVDSNHEQIECSLRELAEYSQLPYHLMHYGVRMKNDNTNIPAMINKDKSAREQRDIDESNHMSFDEERLKHIDPESHAQLLRERAERD